MSETSRRRDPIERDPTDVQHPSVPKAPGRSSRDSSQVLQDLEEVRKSRARNGKPGDRNKPRSSSDPGALHWQIDQLEESDSEHTEETDSQYSAENESISEVEIAGLDYVPSIIAATSDTDSDNALVIAPTPEEYTYYANVERSDGEELPTGNLVNAATEVLSPSAHPRLRHQVTSDLTSATFDTLKGSLPRPITSPTRLRSKEIIRINSNFIRLNFALISVLVHISTQELPSSVQPGTAAARMHDILNSGTLFFPLLITILFEPSSSRLLKWTRNSGFHLDSFWIRMWSLIFVVVIKILVVVEVFQHLPLWIGVSLLVIAVAAFVPFLVVVIVMNLLHCDNDSQPTKPSIREVINVVYGSLVFVHILEMRPSLLNAIMSATSPVLNIASLCFNLAIILQLPALFLEASCVGFCNCVVGRGGNPAGVASLLLTILFQTSLSSFLTAIGVTMFANGVSTLGFCLYVGMAAIFMVLVGCYQLSILPVGSLAFEKQRVE